MNFKIACGTNASIAVESRRKSCQKSYRDLRPMMRIRVGSEVGQKIAPAGGLHKVDRMRCVNIR